MEQLEKEPKKVIRRATEDELLKQAKNNSFGGDIFHVSKYNMYI